MKKELINRIIIALNEAITDTTGLLSEHDLKYGRTTRGNRITAEMYEAQISEYVDIVNELRKY